MCWASGGRETAKQATGLELYEGLCVFLFFSYFLASSLDSLGSQKPKCICVLNFPYHRRTDTLICFSAMDYRNQFALFFPSPPLEGPSIALLVSTGKTLRGPLSVLQPSFIATTAPEEKQTLKPRQRPEDEMVGSSAEHQTVLEPWTHPTMPLPQLSDVHIQIPTPSTPTAGPKHTKAPKKPRQMKSCCYFSLVPILPWKGNKLGRAGAPVVSPLTQ